MIIATTNNFIIINSVTILEQINNVITNGTFLRLQWVHIGLLSNEGVDRLAISATSNWSDGNVPPIRTKRFASS